jgi:hypothetical protein
MTIVVAAFSMDPKSSSLDVGALAAQLGIPEDSLAKVIRYYSLPSIRRTVDGRLVRLSFFILRERGLMMMM